MAKQSAIVLAWALGTGLLLLGCSSGTSGGGGVGGIPGSGGSLQTGGAATGSGGAMTGSGGSLQTDGATTGSGGSLQTGGATTVIDGSLQTGGATTGIDGSLQAGGATTGIDGSLQAGGATTGIDGSLQTGGATTGSGGSLHTGGTTAGSGGSLHTGGTTTGSGGTTSATTGSGGVATVGGCDIFPADNPWNLDISGYPLNANSATYISNMSPTTAFHPDWGTVSDAYGFPFSSGTGATPQPITWTASWGQSESDKLPCPTGSNQFCYPIPLTALIEGGSSAPTDSDRHVLYIDTAGAPGNCTLYELYNAQNPTGSSGWTAANGAIFHLGSNALRTDGWTSADAAGLPILPGLVRFDEVMAGEIRHAIRFTISRSYQGYIHPATHAAGNSSTTLPPMGLRLRLKATFDASAMTGPTLVVVTAMKKFGIILADNGSNWYISGESNEGWAPYMDDLVAGLHGVHGSDFEVVDTGPVSTAGL